MQHGTNGGRRARTGSTTFPWVPGHEGQPESTGPAAGPLPGGPAPDRKRAVLPAEVLAELHWIASEGSLSLSRHARIILAWNEGRSLREIANILDVDRATVRRWLLRFNEGGLRGLVHASTGKTRKRRFDDTVRDAVARLAMASPVAVGEQVTHWSLRRLRAHVLRRGIVQQMSVEGLRQLLHGLPLPDTYWRQGTQPVGPLSEKVRRGLDVLARGPRPDLARRARVVLARSRGLSEAEIASALGVGRSCVRRWLQRFQRHGILGLQTVPRSPRPLVFTADVRAAIVRHARMHPKDLGSSRARWSLRALRAALVRQHIVRKISIQHLGRILAEAGISLRDQPTAAAQSRTSARA
ncbi:MAG: helix-turn-helix domain-containing protein [Candidatus Binatia bacterium]